MITGSNEGGVFFPDVKNIIPVKAVSDTSTPEQESISESEQSTPDSETNDDLNLTNEASFSSISIKVLEPATENTFSRIELDAQSGTNIICSGHDQSAFNC